MTEKLKLCVCGKDTELDRMDSVYPLNRERTEWNVCCQIHNCGCGRTVYGSSAVQAISRWNSGVTDEYIS